MIVKRSFRLDGSGNLGIVGLNYFILIVMLGGLTLWQFRLHERHRQDWERANPPAPLVGLVVSLLPEGVRFSWAKPDSSDLSHILISLGRDGGFPSGPSDGEVILTLWPDVQQADVELGRVDRPTPYAFSLFAVDWSGKVSEAVTVGLFCDLDGCIVVPPLETLIHVQSVTDIDTIRTWILSQIWPAGQMPVRMPDKISLTSDGRYPNALEIVSFEVEMEHKLISHGYFLAPRKPGRSLVIFHQGHQGDFHLDSAWINQLLEAGNYVLALDMPLVGSNQLSESAFRVHDDLDKLSRPLHFFLEPVAVALNMATEKMSFDRVVMLGISGGGWTTTLYTAIDPRIDLAISIAGGYPIYIRDQIPGNDGDLEQRLPAFYSRVSYLDVFILASAGRRYIQVFNYMDPCCSQNAYALSYKIVVQERANQLDGSFEIFIDETATEHAISETAMDVILREIRSIGTGGHAMPHEHEAAHIQFYEDHLRRVRAYFAGRPADLLEVCWEEGNGWEELAGFLGFAAPELPFPHENRGL